ncbi:MAG: peptidoglycan DD-metalloendopeptidase family protein [Clostridiales bacterium]|nr:peptidoglycan DD-metalloendopeptidase family protein [Clostridiales bacterium]
MAGKKRSRKGKYLLAMTLAMTLVTASNLPYIAPAFAVDITQTEQDKKDLKAKNDELNRQLEETRKNTKDKRAHKEALEKKIQLVQQQVRLNNEEIKRLDSEIQTLEDQIADTQKSIDADMETLKKRLRAIYMAGEASTIDIILNSKDINDFLDKAMIVKNVTEHDTQLIQKMKDEMANIQTEKDAIRSNREEAAQLKKELEAQQKELSELMEEDVRLIQELEGEEASLQHNLDENNQELQSIEEEIRQYYEQKKREQEEEERRRREEENNQNNSSNGGSGTNDGNNSNGGNVIHDPNAPVKETTLAWPAPGYYHLNSEWGDGRNHGAIDIGGGIYGKPIVAAGDGTVIKVNSTCTHDFPKAGAWSCGCGGGYGNYVMIAHDDGTIMTVYAHLSRVDVTQGQRVSRSQIIGLAGTTGQSSGPHLHYEVRVNGVKQNPMNWYQ